MSERWATSADLKKKVRGWWSRGDLLRATLPGGEWEPRRVPLRGPASGELSTRFAEARDWIAALRREAGLAYRLEERSTRHRTIGENQVPTAAWFDDPHLALRWIGHRPDAEAFAACVALTREAWPELLPLLHERPLEVLQNAEGFERLLGVCGWVRGRPRPGVYLREVEVPGVDTKFIETRRGLLARMLDRVLSADAVDDRFRGAGGFARRYGFAEKPRRVRVRSVCPRSPGLVPGVAGELTMTAEAFAGLTPGCTRVAVTENETNFLTFPPLDGCWVVFGGGYGFEALRPARWLTARPVAYWGDLDTDGFAMLDQFRGILPHASSLLMDEETLLSHRHAWVQEKKSARGERHRLHPAERRLNEDLFAGRWGDRVRLEQERIGYERVRAAAIAWASSRD